MSCLYVTFILHEQVFGVEISKIKEVMSYRKATPLPNVGGLSRGIINLRGIILPVFDLRKVFSFPETDYTPFHIIMVLEIAGRIMGILADEITDVISLAPDQVQSTADLPSGKHTEYLTGIGKMGEEMVVLLDVDRLLDQRELETLDHTF